jgi:signal transduction histidine kinase
VSTLTAYWRRLAEQARGVPPIVVDAALALACYVTTVIYANLNHGLEWWVVVLVAGNTLPLLWRRRFPFAVTAIVGFGTAWLALVDALGNYAPAQLVATYTFASLCPPLKRLIAAAFTVLGFTLSVVLSDDELLNLGPNTIVFVAAYALGTSARARRDRMAMLEERARRLAEEQDAVATRERERIAREMHDILAHSMSLVVVQAEAGPVAVRTDPNKAEEVFDTISATAREALAQLRRALGVLRSDQPTRQPQPGLDAVPTLVDSVRRAGLAATLEQHGRPRQVPPDLATTAYRLIQEALTNTVKHARASQVRVRLEWLDGALNLEVHDDGRGLAGDGAAGGRGLVGMRERVAAVGGQLTAGPVPDVAGFRVAAHLPLVEDR